HVTKSGVGSDPAPNPVAGGNDLRVPKSNRPILGVPLRTAMPGRAARRLHLDVGGRAQPRDGRAMHGPTRPGPVASTSMRPERFDIDHVEWLMSAGSIISCVWQA